MAFLLVESAVINIIIKHNLWLVPLFLVTIWQAFELPKWSVHWLTILEFLPYVMALIAGFVSFWLNRIQPLLVIISILLINLVFGYFAPSGEESIAQSVLFPTLSFLLPLNLFLWMLLPEKGTRNISFNSFIGSLFAVQLFFVYWLMTELPLQWIESLSLPVVEGLTTYHLPFASSLMFVMAGFLVSMKLQKQQQVRVFTHAVIFILLLMAVALNQYADANVLAWISSVVMLIILLALVFDSHLIAYTDELTGLKGRRALNESFMGLGKKYSLVMIDIDYFKQFNDSYGHDLGDVVLRMVASILDSVRLGGKAYRFGGEEFTIVFPGKSPEQVQAELERLRLEVENEIIYVEDPKSKTSKKKKSEPKTVNVTISLGVAEPDAQHTSAEQVLKFADEALYKAKKSGRNKLVMIQSQPAKKASKKTANKKA